MKYEKITLINGDNEEKELNILFNFEDDETKRTFIYLFENDEEDEVMVFETFEDGALQPITDEKELEFLNEVLQDFLASN